MQSKLESDDFKSLMHDYERSMQERGGQPFEEKNIESACRELLQLHNHSPSALANYLADTQLNLAQPNELTEALRNHSRNLNTLICNLFNASAMETSILKFPPNEHLITTRDLPTVLADDKTHSLVARLTDDFLPGMIAQQIAQLGFYQEHLLEHDLLDPRFGEIYQKASETGDINEADTKYCKSAIETSLRTHHNQSPFFTKDNLASCNFDAWGLHESVLHVYSITPQYDFTSTRIKTEKAIQEMASAIEGNKPAKISDFKITTLCSTIFNSDRRNVHPLKSSVDQLLKDGVASTLDYNALKFVEVDTEVLHIIATTPKSLYKKLQGKMYVGFHSDKSPDIILKDLETQIASSVGRLARAASLAKQLISSKSLSHEACSALGRLIASMAQSIELALAASKRHRLDNNQLNELVFVIQADLSCIQTTLIDNNHQLSNKQKWKSPAMQGLV
ncbi:MULTISPECIES: hypothetical protein [Stenotrophomonas]|uniref:hypothetical protein n=1 Tax=Stenotrophomonas TaxID=40323 RepID=UPI00114CF913|nr:MULTISPECIES: hypothetical protein [Stenotrophomonas]